MNKTIEQKFYDHFPYYSDKIFFVDESQKSRNATRFIMGLDIDSESGLQFKKIEVPVKIALDIFTMGFNAARESDKKNLACDVCHRYIEGPEVNIACNSCQIALQARKK